MLPNFSNDHFNTQSRGVETVWNLTTKCLSVSPVSYARQMATQGNYLFIYSTKFHIKSPNPGIKKLYSESLLRIQYLISQSWIWIYFFCLEYLLCYIILISQASGQETMSVALITSLGRTSPDSKVHGANMGPTWAGKYQVGPMLAPWIVLSGSLLLCSSRNQTHIER